MSEVSLKDLIVPEKQITVEFPGLKGFEVTLCYLGKDKRAKLIKDATITKYVKHAPVTELDEDKFLELFTESTIKGWKGLKIKYVQELVPADIGDHDPESDLGFSLENAILLLKESESFDQWIAEVVGDLENFTKDK